MGESPATTANAEAVSDLITAASYPVAEVIGSTPATSNEGAKNLKLKMELSDYFYAQRPGAKISRNSK